MSSSIGSGDWGLDETAFNVAVAETLGTSSLRMGLEELLGQVKAKVAGALCKCSRLDLEPIKASEEVDASSSPHSTATALGDAVVLVMVEEIGEEVDLGCLAASLCSSLLSLTTGEAWSGDAGKALTQRTGGSALPGGGVCVVGFMKGSGLRSKGGIRSGLEEADLIVFLVKSSDFILPDTVIGTFDGVSHCEFADGFLAWPARGAVLLEDIFESVDRR